MVVFLDVYCFINFKGKCKEMNKKDVYMQGREREGCERE